METSIAYNQRETPAFIPDEKDLTSLKEALSSATNTINEYLSKISKLVDFCENLDDIKAHLLMMANSLELLKTHFEFTFDILQTSSVQEVQTCKEKFKVKGDDYKDLISKEDVNVIILLDVLDFILNDILIIQIDATIQNLFPENDSITDEQRNKRLRTNSPWIEIKTHTIKLLSQFYPILATLSRSDIFSYPKNSQLWQDLQKDIIFKTLSNKEDVQESTKLMKNVLFGFYAAIKTRIDRNEPIESGSSFSFVRDGFSFMKKVPEAELLAQRYLMNPNEYCVYALNISEVPLIRTIQSFTNPHIDYDKCFYIPRLFPQITKEVILNEYQNNSIKKFDPIKLEKMSLENQRSEILKDIFTEREDKVKVRILAAEHLDLQANAMEKIGGMFRKAKGFFSGKNHAEKVSAIDPTAIVIHFHGGAFVSGSSGLSRTFLNRFANELKAIHFSIDYRVAPKNKYPEAIDDIWQAYLWIINYAEPIFGIKHKKVILVGDSAGANLVMALTLRLIRAGLNPPDGCFLIYPSLRMDCSVRSPSLLRAMKDTFISYDLRRTCMKLYVTEEFKPAEDPFLSPMVASDELFAKLPPIRIVIGTDDPLHDETWRFIARLKKLNKDVKAIIYNNYVHGFMSIEKSPGYSEVVTDACNFLKELMK